MPPAGPTEPTRQPVPSFEHGRELIAGISCALATSLAAGNLETESSTGTTSASKLALKTAPLNFNERRLII